MIDPNLHQAVKAKLVITLKKGLPREWGRPTLELKNGKKIFIGKAYTKYVVECGQIKNNNMTLDQLVDFIIEEGK